MGAGDLPTPNVYATRTASGHAQIFYLLDKPVHRGEHARAKPLAYLARVAEFYRASLGADSGFTGVLSSNPVHGDYQTSYPRADPYALADLAAVIPRGWRIPRPATTAEGRNVELFNGLCKRGLRDVEGSRHSAADATSAAPALVEQLDGRGGVARLDLLVEELVGHAVGVPFDLDVVIDVDAAGRPLRHDVAGGGQGPERRAVEPRIDRPAADAELLQRAVVERVEPRPDRGVQRREAEEGVVPQPGEDPPLGHQDARLDFRLVARLRGARRDHDGAVVGGELLIGAMDAGLIAAGPRDGTLELVPTNRPRAPSTRRPILKVYPRRRWPHRPASRLTAPFPSSLSPVPTDLTPPPIPVSDNPALAKGVDLLRKRPGSRCVGPIMGSYVTFPVAASGKLVALAHSRRAGI